MARQTTGFLADFQKFIMQGNVVDLAVAVVIGAAFGKIVSSFVENVIMPIVSLIIPGGSWRNAKIVLGSIPDPADSTKTIENSILIGQFLGTILDFIIVAFVIFLVIRALEAAKKKFARQQAAEEVAEAAADPVVVSQERMTHAMERLTQVMESRS
jgi:large conductance mechanosensitive channel